jgi:THO complex subunit 6
VELLLPDYNKPKHIHTLGRGNQISSLTGTDKFLIVGSVNEISGWEWKGVLSSKLSKPAWQIKISPQSSIEQIDVNTLWLSDDNEKLYAGCGDNKIHVYNLEDGRELSSLTGHDDYIHSVHGK